MQTEKALTGFKVLEDCTLDYTNFEQGEIIEIPVDDCPHDWKGIEWFEKYPFIFEPIYTAEHTNTPALVEDIKCWDCGKPTIGGICNCEKSVADLTGNKVFDTPTSIFLAKENEALKERVKVLEDELQFVVLWGYCKGKKFVFETSIEKLNEFKSTLNPTQETGAFAE
jgi:hypothetical protein